MQGKSQRNAKRKNSLSRVEEKSLLWGETTLIGKVNGGLLWVAGRVGRKWQRFHLGKKG